MGNIASVPYKTLQSLESNLPQQEKPTTSYRPRQIPLPPLAPRVSSSPASSSQQTMAPCRPPASSRPQAVKVDQEVFFHRLRTSSCHPPRLGSSSRSRSGISGLYNPDIDLYPGNSRNLSNSSTQLGVRITVQDCGSIARSPVVDHCSVSIIVKMTPSASPSLLDLNTPRLTTAPP
ncbi:hypothetical protein NMY22_g9865 [Coprinellus aureogranulatus]|nr:hypothetical protein NMY22_g9865 [Coprinellus aureogranulatus]